MKKFASISLAFLLLFSTIGMAKTTHFCMGHAVGSQISLGASHLDCGMNLPDRPASSEEQDPEDCCKNIIEQLQVEEESSLSQVSLDIHPDFVLAFVCAFGFVENEEVDHQSYPLSTKAPPGSIPLHILHQLFLV